MTADTTEPATGRRGQRPTPASFVSPLQARADRSLLRGYHIGFFTSVEEMGGSEVAVTDAIQGAVEAGARVTCWAVPGAAIRQLILRRKLNDLVTIRDWGESPALPSESGVTSHGPDLKSSLHQRIWRTFSPTWLRLLAGYFRDSVRFRKEMSAVKPDLMFIHINGSEGVVLGARGGNRPVVGCFHMSPMRRHMGMIAGLARHFQTLLSMWASSKVVHVSYAVSRMWSRPYLYPRNRTHVIYNGVDLPTLQEPREVVREQLGLQGARFVFCIPGRLHPVKGQRYLLEALAKQPAFYQGMRFLFCGDGSIRPELEAQALAAGLGSTVQFLGWRQDLPRILAASDWTILPSVEAENLSIAVLESLAAGTPAIVTRVGGMAEAVREGFSGYVVPPADPEALSAVIQRVCSDAELTQRLGINARQDVQDRFTRENTMASYANLFHRILAQN